MAVSVVSFKVILQLYSAYFRTRPSSSWLTIRFIMYVFLRWLCLLAWSLKPLVQILMPTRQQETPFRHFSAGAISGTSSQRSFQAPNPLFPKRDHHCIFHVPPRDITRAYGISNSRARRIPPSTPTANMFKHVPRHLPRTRPPIPIPIVIPIPIPIAIAITHPQSFSAFEILSWIHSDSRRHDTIRGHVLPHLGIPSFSFTPPRQQQQRQLLIATAYPDSRPRHRRPLRRTSPNRLVPLRNRASAHASGRTHAARSVVKVGRDRWSGVEGW
jgi:hypothetical protein